MEFMLTLQNGIDDQKPSLFGRLQPSALKHRLQNADAFLELLSEQQLSALIPPSLRYLLVLATHRRPRYLLHVLNSFDELYALLSLAVERHFLVTYGGSFTENFYGLKRERVLRIKGGEAPRARLRAPELLRETLRLRTRDVWNNIVVIVGIPYIKRKLDDSYGIHVPQATILGPSYNRDALPPNPSIRQRILYCYKWFLRNVYPSVNAAYYFSLLAFNLAYLFDNTKYSSPFLWLIGTRIRRLSEADHRAFALAGQKHPIKPTQGARPGQSNSIFNPYTFALTIYPRLLSSLKILLPTSIFALKFLEWWHASDFARQLSRKAVEGLELPPPIVSGLPQKSFRRPTSAPTSPQLTTSQNTVSLSSPSHSHALPPNPRPSRHRPPISSITHLPILTVPAPSPSTSSICPICLHTIQTPTAVQTGYVFCYTCIFKWVDGSHERQAAFMDGSGREEGWSDLDVDGGEGDEEELPYAEPRESESRSEMGGRQTTTLPWTTQDEPSFANQNPLPSPSSPPDVTQRSPRPARWESGKGRCAVTGRRVLGGTDGLRRVMI